MVGPTASGKTSLGVSICEAIGGEVVSCDSMQIYKGMDIATAKPTKAEMKGIPHHLIGFVSPDENYSVAKYCSDAKNIISDIYSRGKKAVLVGGTGLYYSSLVDNIEFFPEETDFEYREELKRKAEAEGVQSLFDMLSELDPDSAAELSPNNLGRVIRALEIIHTTGRTKTEQNRLSKLNPSPFEVKTVCLDAENRQFLYDRINRRVDMMLEAGLVEEAESFFKSPLGATAKQAIGYKELYPFFQGEKSLDECVEELKKQTRHYAKRQLTWFRRDERIKFLYIDKYENSADLISAALETVNGEQK